MFNVDFCRNEGDKDAEGKEDDMFEKVFHGRGLELEVDELGLFAAIDNGNDK